MSKTTSSETATVPATPPATPPATFPAIVPGVVPGSHAASFPGFIEQLDAHIANQPSAIALVDGDQTITWGQFGARVRAVAARLHAAGLGRGDRVAVMAHSCPAYLELFVGTLRLGGCIVPLPMMASADAVAGMLKDSGARVVLASKAAFELLGDGFLNLPSIPAGNLLSLDFQADGWRDYQDWLAQAPDQPPALQPHPGDGFNLIYSSGTTGTPKGILQDHAMRSFQIDRLGKFGFSPSSRTLVATPLYSNTTLVSVIPTLAKGGRLVLMRKFTPGQLCHLVAREQVTHVMLVPVQYERLLACDSLNRTDLSSLQVKFCTSAILRPEVIKAAVKRIPGKLILLYGMTEGGLSTTLDADAHPDKHHTVGLPAADADLRILDDQDRDLPPGQVGEIVGRSPAMMQGYWRRGDLTRDLLWVDEQGRQFIRTGDLGCLDDDGFLLLKGRKKDMVISGGFNIYAADLEQALCGHAAVQEAAVIAIPSETWGETPLGLVVVKPGCQVDPEEIRRAANAKLGKLQRLSAVEIRPFLPRSSIGKVLKRTLAAPYWQDR